MTDPVYMYALDTMLKQGVKNIYIFKNQKKEEDRLLKMLKYVLSREQELW